MKHKHKYIHQRWGNVTQVWTCKSGLMLYFDSNNLTYLNKVTYWFSCILMEFVSCLWEYGSAAIDGLAFQQDDGQIQILTVGHNTTEEGEAEPVMSCTHSQSKQDLRVTMLKKGTVSVQGRFCHCICSSLTMSPYLHPRHSAPMLWYAGGRVKHSESC